MGENRKDAQEIKTEPIHNWFELSYAQYLTIQRTAMQNMPEEWQERFVQCLDELSKEFDWRPRDGNQFWVQMRSESGEFLKLGKEDPFMNYDKGRRRVIPFSQVQPCPECGGNAELKDNYWKCILVCTRCGWKPPEPSETIVAAREEWDGVERI